MTLLIGSASEHMNRVWELWVACSSMAGDEVDAPTRAGVDRLAPGQDPQVWGSTPTSLEGAESVTRPCAKQSHAMEGPTSA